MGKTAPQTVARDGRMRTRRWCFTRTRKQAVRQTTENPTNIIREAAQATLSKESGTREATLAAQTAISKCIRCTRPGRGTSSHSRTPIAQRRRRIRSTSCTRIQRCPRGLVQGATQHWRKAKSREMRHRQPTERSENRTSPKTRTDRRTAVLNAHNRKVPRG